MANPVFDVLRGTPVRGQGARTMRNPQHRFQIESRPWELAPFMLAPVLPGETMENLLVQARVISDPLHSELLGWWYEMYFFYVKHRDLESRDSFTDMMLDPDKDMSAFQQITSPSIPFYTAVGGMKWMQFCVERIVEEYFRHEGELWDDHKFGILPLAQMGQESWLDSAQNVTDALAEDIDVDLDADSTIMASEIDSAMKTWALMSRGGLTQMTYDDWLKTYGIRTGTVDDHKPELIRFSRSWTYPTNVTNTGSGALVSACTWSIAERADKKRFIKEPGFIVGLACARPKVYLDKQSGSMGSFMDDALRWLPALLTNDYRSSQREFAALTGPLPLNTLGYWVDVRDLLMYGDQYINFALTSPNVGMVEMPTIALQKRYASSADADSLFSTTPKLIRADGVVHLKIATQQRDQSGTT